MKIGKKNINLYLGNQLGIILNRRRRKWLSIEL